jgi:TolB-like protein
MCLQPSKHRLRCASGSSSSYLLEMANPMVRTTQSLLYYRPGSYVPVVRLREVFSERRGMRIAVLPFVNASRSTLSGECAQFITDELIHELVRTEGLRVTSASSVGPLVAQALDIPSLARKLDVHIVFEGVREDSNRLRVSVRVVNADGFQILSEHSKRKRICMAFSNSPRKSYRS